ncbi:MAG TPA: response regulator [Terriglobia bacterium]|nr:response regulator [Terriglobia bacterium]
MESTDPIQLDLPLIYSAKVLVVDDDAETRDLLRVFFSGNHYDVLTARDGKEALEVLASDSDIDIVILDVFLPVIGGMEVLREIQSRPSSPGVIVLTALADKEVARDAQRLGAFEYILKPVELARLQAAVEVCLDHREYLKQSWWQRLAS